MWSRTRIIALAIALLAACTPVASEAPTSGADGPASGALHHLADLTVAPERPRDGYDRDDWRHWIDADGDCLNTRHEVLLAESLTPATLSDNGCAVIAGRWHDPFTGMVFTLPSDLDIDHLVPLAEAHDSGADAWTAERRQAYANDLDLPQTLMAVDDASNQRKGDRDPAEWLPPDETGHCAYAIAWVTVKRHWDLAVDPVEAGALELLLARCAALEGVALAAGWR
ncbi:MAG: HNH endonuclease family protein [Azospirillaceae bacterium]